MTFILRYAYLALGYIQTINITDIIDMAVVAYLIYRLLLLSRKTRTGQVLKGVILIVVALGVSYYFNLHIINFILTKAVEIGFLALIILFQPEIRRFLEQVGTRTLAGIFGRQQKVSEIERAIQQTVSAAGSMSSDHIGALIVFERESILDECTRSGTEIDAEVSDELLKNIFWPKAPMHDGAVVIRSGRIHSAGCMLPLTTNLNVSRELGTRHRAAIGISEHSDAVVVIVSEETGAISAASDGMLKRHLTPETLERLLRNELIREDETAGKSSLRDRLGSFVKGGSDDVG